MDKIERARQLGTEHGQAGDMPYAPGDGSDVDGYDPYSPDGYTSYVYWDAGSAGLMTELGETEDTSDGNWAGRIEMTRAYCEAYAQATGTPFDTTA